jgi:hypothetical protein
MKRELGAAGIGALAVLAVVGWTRAPQPVSAVSLPTEATPATLAMYSDTAAAPVTYPMPRAGVRTASPVVKYQNQEAQAEAASRAVTHRDTDAGRNERAAVRATGRSADVDDYRDDRQVKQERSTGKSAAIIGGGAAAGAAIGAMAGGGKGAAIGALTGGAAGLIYDRMTKKNGDKIF